MVCCCPKYKLCRFLITVFFCSVLLCVVFSFLIAGKVFVVSRSSQRWKLPALIIEAPNDNNLYPMLVTLRESPVDIIVRAVYFDDRPRDGHDNTTVFLLDVTTDLIKYNIINGCGVDKHKAVSYKVRDCLLNVWLRKSGVFEEGGMTHWCILLDCYDVPAASGSKAFVYYDHHSVQHIQRGQWVGSENQIHRTVSVESSQPMIFPLHLAHIKKNSKYNFSVAVCRGPVFGTPPFLSEWLRYQKTIGIDSVYFVVEDSFLYDGGLQIPEVAKALKEGYLSYSVWKSPLDDVVSYYRSQLLVTQDCLYRLQGVSDYVLVVDTDDFFNPLTSHKSLHYYVDKFCHRNRTCGALNMRWIQRHTECGLKGEIPPDGNVTSVLASEVRHEYDIHGKVNYKTVHRTQTELDIQVHKHGLFLPGYDHVLLSMSEAYVAHVREHKLHEGTRCARSYGGLNISVRCVC